LKARLCNLDVTLFCIHGNKENHPENIPTYGVQTFCGGIVYYEPRYPNIFFAKDGEVYNFNGKEFMVVGGAHSVDKIRCLEEDLPFWEDEMPSDEIKSLVESKLAKRGNKIDGFLTHTCPISCMPTEMFISTNRAAEDQKRARQKGKKKEPIRYPIDIDRSTEEWLETLMQKNEHEIWYCGHYHVDKTLGKVRMLHREILPFCEPNEERL
jgi:3-oxoacid CoA-transferase subunit A